MKLPVVIGALGAVAVAALISPGSRS